MTPDLPTTLVGHGQELEIEWTSVDIGSYFDLETGPSEFDYRFLVPHIGGDVKAGPILGDGQVRRWFYYERLEAALWPFGWRIP